MAVKDSAHNVCSGDKAKIFERKNVMKHKFRLLDNTVLDDAAYILSGVLADSKEKPWGIFIGKLNHYVDWLYLHSFDVALISLIIAIELHYKKETLQNICLGALLHDIGKLSIPSPIIQKPGKLAGHEMFLMKQHCELGYDMIKGLDLQKECKDVILQHHECLDGSGYPYGLQSSQIADTAKIVMIADILDAITSYRPYKPAQPLNNALKELKRYEQKYETEIIRVLEKYL